MTERIQFDPEEDRPHYPDPPPRLRDRLRLRITLPCLLAVVVALGAGWVYKANKPPATLAMVPEIHPDAAPVKEAPANPGGMVVPDQDSALLNREGKPAAKVEQLLPPPEPVLPRPIAPPPQAQETALAPPPRPAAPAQPPVTQAAPAPPPSTTHSAAAAAAAHAAPAAAPKAASAAPQPVPAAAASGWRLQLGAVRSEAAAREAWQRLKTEQPDILGKLALATPRVDLGAKGIFYRVQAGPIADGNVAERSCAALKARHVGCLVVKP
ncbi:MAG TPA: SPOR domain-containing protein [Stellaceae bacterium]|jgi:cell division septation protein DedD|nr:SPOR domain-containing protein [Stellaceae bacterium]